ncbi:N utilization substance protein B [Rhynchospora pubera]|uniref:N utilization substance protein B n=1 Tax=Rhynchospora pubera TaxID=906938 RepID=A0AAV8HTE8_9POAL|nr:N utilization substance protein B [Rhynchospora pubera]
MYRILVGIRRRRRGQAAVGGGKGFRSEAALDAIRCFVEKGREQGDQLHVALYNYPSISGAYAALFASLFHSKLRLPFLPLPFSSFHPFKGEDFKLADVKTCYLLDFIGPKDFSLELSKFIPRVIAFDHHQRTAIRISKMKEKLPSNLDLQVDSTRCSARAAFDYFSAELIGNGDSQGLLNLGELERVKYFLRYIEDSDLCHRKLHDIKYFNAGIKDLHAKLNCIVNPHLFDQLLEIDASSLIAKGRSVLVSRENAANTFIKNPFKIHLGRGLYGECLAVRSDGNSNLSHEISLELSRRSSASGLRPIGAAVFMQRGNVKVCLRSFDNMTDTSEIARVYGGGGKPSSSSFTLRMDEYNLWTSVNVPDSFAGREY